jgi:hypothetical protein
MNREERRAAASNKKRHKRVRALDALDTQQLAALKAESARLREQLDELIARRKTEPGSGSAG